MRACVVCGRPTSRERNATCSAECRRTLDARETAERAARRAERYSHTCAVCGVRFVRHSFQVECCSRECGTKYRLRPGVTRDKFGKGSSRELARLCGRSSRDVPPVSDTAEWHRIYECLATLLPIAPVRMCHLALNAIVWAEERRLVRFDGKYWRKAR